MNEWSQEEEDFLSNNFDKLDYKTIGEILNRSYNSILIRSSKLKLKKRKGWSKQEQEKLIINWNKPIKEVLKLFPNKTYNNIRKKAYLLKLKRTRFYFSTGKLDILLKDTHNSFYWIGFLLADGHFSKNNTLEVTLSNIDKKHLQKLKKFLSISKIENLKKELLRIRCCDTYIIKLIKKKFDINNRKTYIPPKFLPTVADSLLISLLIGFIDGDGCILKKRNSINSECFVIKISCYYTWEKIFNKFNELIKSYFKINNPPPIISKKKKQVRIHFHKKEIINGLKNHAESNKLPCLKRKWSKIKFKNLNNSRENTRKRNDNIIYLCKSGISVKKIAKKYNISEQCIRSLLYLRGLKLSIIQGTIKCKLSENYI